MKPMAPRIPRLLDTPIAFAHRGASAHEQENTIAAFELALRLGATGLESDVWLTADGQAVLDHDGVFGRFGRRRRIPTMERAALPDYVPSLDEALDALGTDYEFSLDMKDGAAIEAVVASIDRVDPGSDSFSRRVWLCHPDLDLLISWRDRWPHLRYVNSARLPNLGESIEKRAARLAAAGIDVLNMHYSDWTGGLTTLLHRFGVLTFGWDAQHERVLTELLDIGCDGVYSDYVDRMMAVVQQDLGDEGSEPADVVEGPDP